MKRKIAVLGVTGSIGRSTLDVITHGKEYFEPVLFSAHTNRSGLEEASRLWPGVAAVLSGEPGGKEKLLDAIARSGAGITLNGISGSAGLEPTMAAIETGSDIALANKETLVMAGNLVLKQADKKGVKIIPVDSEHSAIFNLLEAHGYDDLDEIILTASGGPFRNYTAEEMKNVTVKEALAHPTWNMGTKISIDSATMANKGLEIIEAVRLFGLPPEKIKVIIHPQSIVHSMIRMKDGSIYAQLSRPDMRLPIQKALYWQPKNAWGKINNTVFMANGFGRLDFDNLSLEFYKPDFEKFPLPALACEAVKKGGLYPCAYNAANEAAVTAFICGKIGFNDIGRITHNVLDCDWSEEPSDIASVMEADRKAGITAEKEI